MSEKLPTFESGKERIPTKEELLGIFEKFAEGKSFEVTKDIEDEKGVRILEIKLQELNERGETVEYAYRRDGSFNDRNERIPCIDIYLTDSDGVPTADNIAKCIDGEWRFFDR